MKPPPPPLYTDFRIFYGAYLATAVLEPTRANFMHELENILSDYNIII